MAAGKPAATVLVQILEDGIQLTLVLAACTAANNLAGSDDVLSLELHDLQLSILVTHLVFPPSH